MAVSPTDGHSSVQDFPTAPKTQWTAEGGAGGGAGGAGPCAAMSEQRVQNEARGVQGSTSPLQYCVLSSPRLQPSKQIKT